MCRRRGRQKAMLALARRLAVIMHRMSRDGTEFLWKRQDIMPKAAWSCARPLQPAGACSGPVKGKSRRTLTFGHP